MRLPRGDVNFECFLWYKGQIRSKARQPQVLMECYDSDSESNHVKGFENSNLLHCCGQRRLPAAELPTTLSTSRVVGGLEQGCAECRVWPGEASMEAEEDRSSALQVIWSVTLLISPTDSAAYKDR